MTENCNKSRHYHFWFIALWICSACANVLMADSTEPCIGLCEEQIDYQHTNTELVFSRYDETQHDETQQLAGHDQQAANESQAWRHRYEIVLTQQGDSRVVFDQYGTRHVFHPRSEGGYSAQSPTSGKLQQHPSGYQWVNNTGLIHRFHGSYLIEIIFPDAAVESAAGAISSSSSSSGSETVSGTASASASADIDTESESESDIHNIIASFTTVNSAANSNTTPATTALQASTQTLNLQYTNNRLSSVTDQLGNQILFNSSAPGLVSVTTPDGNTLTYADPHCSTGEPTEPARCDTAAHPLPDTIYSQIDRLQSSTQTSITHLDARPASCNSYFTDYFGTERGSQIESGVGLLQPYSAMQSTVRSFPIVDFINGSELVVIRSRDLSSPSFNNPEHASALLERLLRDGSEIQSRLLDPLDAHGSISHTEQGQTTTISQQPDQSLVLQLLIQQHIASPSHWQQIEQAQIQLMTRYGIQLEVVLIP